MRSVNATLLLLVLLTSLSGCRDQQSVLAPQSLDADRVALLTWILFLGGIAILVAVTAVAAVSLYGTPRLRGALAREATVVSGGLVFPVVTLTALLAYGLGVTRAGITDTPAREPLKISVIGQRWWWRIDYVMPDGTTVPSANELRIPVGRPVQLALSATDVIHSFWVPALAGKIDMIPGRKTQLTFTASRPGILRGQCAEYCGGAHALMAIVVVVLEANTFDDWLRQQSRDARAPALPERQRGLQVFQANGCGGCHTIRGTDSNGTIGPDLTHFGDRHMLGAATLPNDAASVEHWIADNQRIKPENLMLPYRNLSESDLAALATYLTGLK